MAFYVDVLDGCSRGLHACFLCLLWSMSFFKRFVLWRSYSFSVFNCVWVLVFVFFYVGAILCWGPFYVGAHPSPTRAWRPHHLLSMTGGVPRICCVIDARSHAPYVFLPQSLAVSHSICFRCVCVFTPCVRLCGDAF